MNFQKVIHIGAVLCTIGMCVGTIFHQKIIGVNIFMIGLLCGAIAIVGEHLKMPNLGLKISAVGFSITTIAFFMGFYINVQVISSILFYVGIFIGFVGVVIMFIGIKNKQIHRRRSNF